MALLNSTCTYAIRAALQVAIERPEPGAFVSIRRIADALDVPFAFLTKVLQGLTQAGILQSQRGATGGVALARPASEIRLLDVLAAVGSDGIFRECVLGLPTCSDAAPCALHSPWREQRSRLEDLFTRTTLADLAGKRPDKELAEVTKPAAKARTRSGRTRRTP
jgi:Rrf2 family iron-sulfur cluster assembly transcriptional regulator